MPNQTNSYNGLDVNDIKELDVKELDVNDAMGLDLLALLDGL